MGGECTSCPHLRVKDGVKALLVHPARGSQRVLMRVRLEVVDGLEPRVGFFGFVHVHEVVLKIVQCDLEQKAASGKVGMV